ncbi:MAG: glutamate formimidoyltransferase, partial [Candidatus Dadabacteria bacterium]|nr:glutamate formimidoyltransferase [Candidatus Dadabacteria bacterium]
AGEYEGLAEKIRKPEWAPDYGEPFFNAKSGAVITGARNVLVAYNINLGTSDVRIAQDIAATIRQSGRTGKDRGNAAKVPGKFSCVMAMGWYIEKYGFAQVSMNLTDYRVTSPRAVYDEVKRLAKEHGTAVNGSEIIGLVPKDALLAAGRPAADESETIKDAVDHLGLSSISRFEPRKSIIEYVLEDNF